MRLVPPSTMRADLFRLSWVSDLIDRSETRGDHEDCEFSAFKNIQAPMSIECVSCRHRPCVRICFACRGSQRIVSLREAIIYPPVALLCHHATQSKSALTHRDFVVL